MFLATNHISSHIIKNVWCFAFFSWIVFFNIFEDIIRALSLLLLMKYCYFASCGSFPNRYILSISGWLFIKFNNAFVFPDPEPPIINNNLLWSSGICSRFKKCSVLFSSVVSSKLITSYLHVLEALMSLIFFT